MHGSLNLIILPKVKGEAFMTCNFLLFERNCTDKIWSGKGSWKVAKSILLVLRFCLHYPDLSVLVQWLGNFVNSSKFFIICFWESRESNASTQICRSCSNEFDLIRIKHNVALMNRRSNLVF